MSNHKSRIEKLERRQVTKHIAFAELLGDGRAILFQEDGECIEATEADVPIGTKAYAIISPNDWDEEPG